MEMDSNMLKDFEPLSFENQLRKKEILDHVFEDSYTDLYEHLFEKYERKIDEMFDIRDQWLREKAALDNELVDMLNTKEDHSVYFHKHFNQLVNRETEIGALLLDSSTGKKVSEKVYGRLIQRQKLKSSEIAEIRLIYIKNRDKVRDIESRLKSLETIDGTLHLMDFEQLRMENTTYADKIEEREEELMRLRDRHSHANQALAHTREKLNVIVEDIEEKKEDSVLHEFSVSEIREYLNELKIKRDANRSQAEKLNLNSGLLTYPRLLLDMEQSLHIEEKLTQELEELKTTNKDSRSQLIAIRVAIEHAEHTMVKRKAQHMINAQAQQEFYMGRPTIFIPKFPKTFIKPIHIK